MDIKDMLPLREYAEKIGRHPDIVRQKCLRGNVPGAVKLGRDWLIPADAPYPDKRIKTGKYIDWRKRPEAESNESPT